MIDRPDGGGNELGDVGGPFGNPVPPPSSVHQDFVFDPRFYTEPPINPSPKARREDHAYTQDESGKDYAHRKVVDLLIDAETGQVKFGFLMFIVVITAWMVMLYQDNGANQLQTLDGCLIAASKAAMVFLTVATLVFVMTLWRSGAMAKPMPLFGKVCPGHWFGFVLLVLAGGTGGFVIGKDVSRRKALAGAPPANVAQAKMAVAKANYDLAMLEAKAKPEAKK